MDREYLDELFERWQSLDKEERQGIFPSLFGRMRQLNQGSTADKEVAERFFMEVENLLEKGDKNEYPKSIAIEDKQGVAQSGKRSGAKKL